MSDKQGNTVVLETADGREFVFERPGRLHLKRLQDEVAAGGSAFDATYHFVVSLARKPEPRELKRLFEAEPGLVMALGNKLLELAGATVEVRVKNLKPA